MAIMEKSFKIETDSLDDEYFKGLIRSGCLRIMGETEPSLSCLPIVTPKNEMYDFYAYEYIWTLSFMSHLDKRERPTLDWIKCLKKTNTIIVQIFFRTSNTNYTVRELTATLKPPLMTNKNLWDTFCDSWMKITGRTAKLIGDTTKIPSVSQVGEVMDMLGELEKDVVPSSHAYPWYLKTIVTTDEEGNLLNGVEWTIDRKAFHSIGNRLMGGICLMFIKSSGSEKIKAPVKLDVRARITFKELALNEGKHHDFWIPANPNRKGFEKNGFFLEVNPKCETL
ncbi:TPA: hypothetical protein HA338_00350 [Methanosarcina acetivorans]|nr:hypothetical protein [Methanosarcina acetivorans]HIH92545.1 hypothetical protein [Methanosarcina acetivorans]